MVNIDYISNGVNNNQIRNLNVSTFDICDLDIIICLEIKY